jgi:hypothetical protein
MAIDMASVYAERFRQNPNALRAAVMGQSPDPKLDSYTALNALRLIKEADMMAMAAQAQQPTSSPSILAETLAPPAPPQGLAGMPMGAPAGQMPQGQMPQGMPPQGQMPQGMPPQQAPVMRASGGLAGMSIPEEEYAAGGIVAFSGPTEENNYSLVSGDAPEKLLEEEMRRESFGTDLEPGWGGGDASPTALGIAQARLDEYMKYEPKEMSAKEQEAFLDRYMARMKKAAGEDIYAPAKERLAAREAALVSGRRSDEGLALLTAAGKILKGRSLAEGASEALPAFAQQMGEARKAEQQEKRAIEQMNFALADAQRKERMGDARGAQSALEAARKFQQDANKAHSDKLRYGADIAARTVQYSKPRGAGAGSGPKLPERLADAEEAYANDPTPENKARVQALSSAASKVKTSYSTSEIAPEKARTATAPVLQRIDERVNEGLDKFTRNNAAYRRAKREGRADEAQTLYNAEKTRLRTEFEISENAASGGGGGSSSKPKVIKLD